MKNPLLILAALLLALPAFGQAPSYSAPYVHSVTLSVIESAAGSVVSMPWSAMTGRDILGTDAQGNVIVGVSRQTKLTPFVTTSGDAAASPTSTVTFTDPVSGNSVTLYEATVLQAVLAIVTVQPAVVPPALPAVNAPGVVTPSIP